MPLLWRSFLTAEYLIDKPLLYGLVPVNRTCDKECPDTANGGTICGILSELFFTYIDS
jgi:hypothetical protein